MVKIRNFISYILYHNKIENWESWLSHLLYPQARPSSIPVPGEPWRGQVRAEGRGSWLLQQGCACSGGAVFPHSAPLWDSASTLSSQVNLPSKGPKCFAVFSFHLSFDWVEASSLPGINIHNKQQAINLTSWNLLCTRLNSKPASAGCLFFADDALHMTAPKHLNLKHSIVENSCCPLPLPQPPEIDRAEFHTAAQRR